MTATAFCASNKLTLSPPVMFTIADLAPEICASNNGDWIAFSAAEIALSSPSAIPIPINARPWFCITLRTSAKSKFTNAGTAIKSEIV